MHWTGWNNHSMVKQLPSGPDVLLLMSIFHLLPGLKLSFKHSSASKNLFLSGCFCWDSRPFISDKDQKSKFGGTFVYGDSYLEFLFRDIKVFRLHAILHDADGAVQAQRGKSPGYCYMVVRGPISCWLGHPGGLLFCLHVKLFLLSIFISIDFSSKMCCMV